MSITNVTLKAPTQTGDFQHYFTKWAQLGLDLALLDSSPDFVKFMIDTGLAYTVMGYYNSQDHTEQGQWDVPIFIDNEQPHLMYQGHWTPWSELKNVIAFSKNESKFISNKNPLEGWTYVYPDGFIQKDPITYAYPFPIFHVSRAQHRALKELASHYQEYQEEKECILQFYTSPERPSQKTYQKNFHWATNVHSAVRLVTSNGDLYSFGICGNKDQIDAKIPNGQKLSRMALATASVYIKMLDCAEFRPFYKRLVTSIPLTQDQADRLLARVQVLNSTPLRYNAFAQNCYTLMDVLMKELHFESPVQALSVKEVIWIVLPNAEDYVGPIISAVSNFFIKHSPTSLFTENIAATIFTNSLFCFFGGGKEIAPFEGTVDEPFWQTAGFSNFSCLYPTWGALLNPEIAKIQHHYPFMQWQYEQGSSFEIENSVPKLHFLP